MQNDRFQKEMYGTLGAGDGLVHICLYFISPEYHAMVSIHEVNCYHWIPLIPIYSYT